MGFYHLAIVILQQIRTIPVQHTRAARSQRGRMLAGGQPETFRFHANQLNTGIGNVGIKNAHSIRSPADTRNHGIRLTADEFRHLHLALFTDHFLKIAHHHRVGMRPGHRADDVKRIGNIGYPIAHGFVERIFQCFRARLNGHHRCAQQLHAIDVGGLPLDIL